MVACLCFTALGAAALIAYLAEKTRRYTVRAVFLKTLVSTLFVTTAVCAAFFSGVGFRPFSAFVLLGLVFGLLGDIWLDLKYVFPEKDAEFTYAGFAVFAVGHVLYITGLILTFYKPGQPVYIFAPLLLAAALGAGNVKLEKPMKLNYGAFRPVVACYGAFLFAAVLFSGSLALQNGWQEPALNVFFIGTALFAASDLVLSGTYFGQGKERSVDLILNYLFYYSAQFLIALTPALLR